MFDRHQKTVSEFARLNPDNFARVLKFVIVTIKAPLNRVPVDMEIVEQEQPGIDGVLYGWKRTAIREIEEERYNLYELAESIYFHAESDRIAAENLINLFTTITGLGLSKAGFCAQLIYGVGGCLDSHNLERFGINPLKIKSSRYKNAKTHKTRARILSEYCDLCEQFGGVKELWNSWCNYVAERQPRNYNSGFEVSALHCSALGLPV